MRKIYRLVVKFKHRFEVNSLSLHGMNLPHFL